MHTFLFNILKSFSLLFISFFLISADLHFNTSASMRYKDIKIKYLDKSLTANLDSPGVELKKYPNGRLERLTLHKINSVIELYFHPAENGSEKVALVQHFRVFNGLLLLDGPLQRLSYEGDLLNESNWQKGRLHGRQVAYDRDQNLIEEKWFDQGVPVQTWRLFYSSGNVASEISFPKTLNAWKHTLIKNKDFTQNSHSIQSTPYFRHPQHITESWYTPSGKLTSKHYYELYQTADSFAVKPSDNWAYFNDEGKEVVSQKRQYDKKLTQSYYSSLGRMHHQRDTWLNDQVFKSQHYINLSEESLIQD